MSPHEPNPPGPDDERPLAAEFVLGLVEGSERAELERRCADDPAFAEDVAFWETRLGTLAEEVASAPVSPDLWRRIAEEIGAAPAARRGTSRAGLWHSLPFWRGLGLATSALAAACLVLLAASPATPPPSLVAALQLPNGASAFMASVDRTTGRLMLMPAVDTPAPPQHTHELWIVPPGGSPHSLGTFVARGPVVIVLPAEMKPHAGAEAALAISVEPMGGSPTGQPTGPVVAQGKMHEL